MKGQCLRLHMYDFEKHHGIALYEWLLECGKKQGLEGSAVYRAIAGYGRGGKIHEEHFFELASNVPVQVVFISEKEKIQAFLETLKQEKISLFYAVSEVDYGILI